MQPERRNTIKVLLFFDIGGSMDSHIKVCEELFSAAQDRVQDTWSSSTSTTASTRACGRTTAAATSRRSRPGTCCNKFGSDYKVIFVGDATMSPYEITYPGGSVEHWNEEPGAIWMDRVAQLWNSVVWLNPVPQRHWDHTPSIGLLSSSSTTACSR